jgi:hypothetical protein
VTDANLKTTGNGGGVGKTDGADLLFTASDGTTKLDHEIETYVATSGQTIAWVRIPTLSPTENTVIYVYYGNASALDQQNKTAVWDSNFLGVYHLGNGTALSVADSKGLNTATNHGAAAATAKIGGGASSTDSASYVDTGISASAMTLGAGTASVWFNAGSGSTNAYNLLLSNHGSNSNNNGIDITYGTFGALYVTLADASAHFVNVDVSSPTTGWVNCVLAWDGAVIRIYVNGTLALSYSYGNHTMSALQNLMLFGGGTAPSYYYYQGQLDEVRISNSARSTDWIVTEYNNQSSPPTFFTTGAQQ